MCDPLGIDGPHIEQMIASDGLPPQQEASVSLPASLFQKIDGSSNIEVFYGIYNSSILFPVSASQGNDTSADRQTQVVSNVVAVTVGRNVPFQNLPEPVMIVLRLQKEEGMVSKADFNS